MENFKDKTVKRYTSMSKPSTEAASFKVERTVMVNIIMVMGGLGKGSGGKIDKMDLEGIRIRRGLLLRVIGLMESKVMTVKGDDRIVEVDMHIFHLI
jgi:hypothetical protein